MIIRKELKIIAEALKSLTHDKIIRSKNLVGDLGEYYCKEMFGLTIVENYVNKGFDAIDNKGLKVEIKTRRIPDGKSKVIFRGFDFDYCLYVELDEYFELNRIVKVSSFEIQNNLDKRGDRLSVSKINKTKHVLVYTK